MESVNPKLESSSKTADQKTEDYFNEKSKELIGKFENNILGAGLTGTMWTSFGLGVHHIALEIMPNLPLDAKVIPAVIVLGGLASIYRGTKRDIKDLAQPSLAEDSQNE